ncbi:MAG: ABC transporter permease, partial [Lachnospiraceae bacterium]|nr:ABC transporter permease [Lachnospiraceae bacterium]
RDTFRHKARSFMTLLGVMGCVIILIATFGIDDMLHKFLDENYNGAINYNNMIFLDGKTVTMDDVEELGEKYNADRSSQMSILINYEKTASLEVMGLEHGYVRYLGPDSGYVDLGDDGAYICRRIRDEFDLDIGDTFSFSLYGSDKKYTAKVAGYYRSTTEGVAVTEKYAEEIGLEFKPNLLYTQEEDIASESRILNVQSKSNIMKSFDTFIDILMLMIVLMSVAAVLLGIIVLYNLGVMSYTERYREMATLKVLGFKDRKIGQLLTSQNLWLTAAGIIVGIPAGIAILKYLMDALAGEYELKLYVSPRTYIVTIALTLGMSLLVSLMISKKNKKIDMVEALKTEE